MPEDRNATEFDGVAKTLHWLMATLLIAQLLLGWLMTEQSVEILDGGAKRLALHWHEALGLTLLCLALARLGWRLTHPPPPLPSYLPGWERRVAIAAEWALYAVFIGLPVVGWMIISTMAHPASFLGLFPIPNLPLLHDLPDRKDWREVLVGMHFALAIALVALVLAHAGAALKHHLIDRDDLLFRIAPRSWRSRLDRMR